MLSAAASVDRDSIATWKLNDRKEADCSGCWYQLEEHLYTRRLLSMQSSRRLTAGSLSALMLILTLVLTSCGGAPAAAPTAAPAPAAPTAAPAAEAPTAAPA